MSSGLTTCWSGRGRYGDFSMGSIRGHSAHNRQASWMRESGRRNDESHVLAPNCRGQ
jgi:hypothetical protein